MGKVSMTIGRLKGSRSSSRRSSASSHGGLRKSESGERKRGKHSKSKSVFSFSHPWDQRASTGKVKIPSHRDSSPQHTWVLGCNMSVECGQKFSISEHQCQYPKTYPIYWFVVMIIVTVFHFMYSNIDLFYCYETIIVLQDWLYFSI